MKLALRLIATWLGFLGVVFLLLSPFLILGGASAGSGRAWLALGLLSLAGPLGLFSGVQLFRLRESGRRGALAFVFALVLFGMAQYRKPPEMTFGTLIKLGLMVAAVAVLVSDPAKQLCLGQPAVPQQVSSEPETESSPHMESRAAQQGDEPDGP